MLTLVKKPHEECTSQILFSTLGLPAHYHFWSDNGVHDEVVNAKLLLTLRQGVEAYEGEAAAKAFDTMVTDLGVANLRTLREGLFALEQNSWEYRLESNHWSVSHSDDELPLANFAHSQSINLDVRLRNQRDHEETELAIHEYLALAGAVHEKPTTENWMKSPDQLSMPAPK
jgi:hypothetical protein